MEFNKNLPSTALTDGPALANTSAAPVARQSATAGQAVANAATQVLGQMSGTNHFSPVSGSGQVTEPSAAYRSALKSSMTTQATEAVHQDILKEQSPQIRKELCNELTKEFMKHNGF